MSRLTLNDFEKLSESEKKNRYKELSNHDKFLVRTSMPIGGKTVGFRKLTKEEEKEAKEFEEAVKSGNINKWFKKNSNT